MSRRRPGKKYPTQEDILSTSAYTKLLRNADEIKRTAKSFGLKPDKAYALTITALLTASMKQFLEIRHLQGEDRGITSPQQEVELMEDLVHDVGAFMTNMMEIRDPGSEYRVEFVRKDC